MHDKRQGCFAFENIVYSATVNFTGFYSNSRRMNEVIGCFQYNLSFGKIITRPIFTQIVSSSNTLLVIKDLLNKFLSGITTGEVPAFNPALNSS